MVDVIFNDRNVISDSIIFIENTVKYNCKNNIERIKKMFDRIKAKEKSKTLLRTRSFIDFLGYALITSSMSIIRILFIPAILFAVVSILIGYATRSFSSSLSSILGFTQASFAMVPATAISTSIILIFTGIIAVGIALLFQAGMNRAALRMNRGDKNVRILDIILAGDRLSRYIAITLWQVLFIFLWTLPSVAAIVIAIAIIVNGGGSSTASAFAVIFVIAACIWGVYITINKICQYYYAYCVAEDNRDLAALDCIRESSNLMVDHKWELFVTMLSFLGWDIITAIPCAAVFVIPYKYLTYTSIYEQLVGNFKPVIRSHMQWLNNGTILPKIEDVETGERVVEILSGEFAGASLPVKVGEDITIGRDPKRANVVTSPANTSISGLHCRIRYDEQNGKYIVIDHSSNGTYLNNEKLIQEKITYAARGSLVKLADGAMILRLS